MIRVTRETVIHCQKKAYRQRGDRQITTMKRRDRVPNVRREAVAVSVNAKISESPLLTDARREPPGKQRFGRRWLEEMTGRGLQEGDWAEICGAYYGRQPFMEHL